MVFALTPDWRHGAVDTETNSQLVIKSTPEIGTLAVEFQCEEGILKTAIHIQRKFPDQPATGNDPANPEVMISTDNLNAMFCFKNMRDIDKNTILVKRTVRMIAFINKSHPLAGSPFLWSDYNKVKLGHALFRLPSDEELLAISNNPEE
jgi:hypothetical protein